MIQEISLQNFKSFQSTSSTVILPSFFAVVGMNAVGKTNLIQSISFLKGLVAGKDLAKSLSGIVLTKKELFNFNSDSNDIKLKIRVKNGTDISYELSLTIAHSERGNNLVIKEEKLQTIKEDKKILVYQRKSEKLFNAEDNEIPLEVGSGELAVALYKNADVSEVRRIFDTIVISDNSLTDLRESFTDRSSVNLANILSNLKRHSDPKVFENFSTIMKKLVPSFSSIVDIKVGSNDETQSEAEKNADIYLIMLEERGVKDRLSMSLISDGDFRTMLLIATAFSMAEGGTLIIEEIENGLHPRRLKNLLDHLTTISKVKNLQIMLTTHSPVVINSLRHDEVLFISKDENGSNLTALDTTEDIGKIKEFLNSGGRMTDYLLNK